MELTRPVRTPNFDPDQSMVEPTANGSIANRREENSLKEAERHRILYEWNDTRTEFPAFCAHQLFEHQVQRAPEAIAVVFEDQRLSYRELNAAFDRDGGGIAGRLESRRSLCTARPILPPGTARFHGF